MRPAILGVFYAFVYYAVVYRILILLGVKKEYRFMLATLPLIIIGIASTKDDFLRIIKEKNPDEDLDQLKGKVLFDRISELHISRLRTKEDLVRLLQS